VSFESIWNRAKAATSVSREGDRQFYEQVAQEMRLGARDDGVWLMAFEKAEGDEARAKAYYIGLRVQRLKEIETIKSFSESTNNSDTNGDIAQSNDRNALLSCPYCTASFAAPHVVCPRCSRVLKA
jgi:hypothetical protein